MVALGATAVGALTGWKESVRDARHELLRLPSGTRVVATWHPSAILRAPPSAAARMRDELADDLARAARLAAEAAVEAGDDEDEPATGHGAHAAPVANRPAVAAQ